MSAELIKAVIGQRLTAVLQMNRILAQEADGITSLGTFAVLNDSLIVELDYRDIVACEPQTARNLVAAQFLNHPSLGSAPSFAIGKEVIAVLHSDYWVTAGLLLSSGCILRTDFDSTYVSRIGPFVDYIEQSDFSDCFVLPDTVAISEFPELIEIAIKGATARKS